MTVFVWPALALLGLVVGAYGTLIGAGGGFVLVPLLLLLYPGDRRIPWHRARRVFLDRVLQARKRQALAETRSRFRSDDPRARGAALLARSVHPDEIVFV